MPNDSQVSVFGTRLVVLSCMQTIQSEAEDIVFSASDWIVCTRMKECEFGGHTFELLAVTVRRRKKLKLLSTTLYKKFSFLKQPNVDKYFI